MKVKKVLVATGMVVMMFSLVACSVNINAKKENDIEKKIEAFVENKIEELDEKMVDIDNHNIVKIEILDKESKVIATIEEKAIIDEISEAIENAYENNKIILKLPKDIKESYTYLLYPEDELVKDLYLSFKVYSNYDYITMSGSIVPMEITATHNKEKINKLNNPENFVEINK